MCSSIIATNSPHTLIIPQDKLLLVSKTITSGIPRSIPSWKPQTHWALRFQNLSQFNSPKPSLPLASDLLTPSKVYRLVSSHLTILIVENSAQSSEVTKTVWPWMPVATTYSRYVALWSISMLCWLFGAITPRLQICVYTPAFPSFNAKGVVVVLTNLVIVLTIFDN